jgi:hypothetical protein
MQMKTTMMALMIAALAAGTAFAEEGDDDQENTRGKAWSHGGGDQPGWQDRDDDDDQDRGGKQAWQGRDDDDDDRGDKQAWKQNKRGGRPGGPMDPAMMEQMKADHKEIRALGEAARAVTSEAAKAEIVAQLRAKLGEVADRMQAHQEKRLAQAEEHLASLKAKFEDAKANRDKLIEEQVQRVLKGEKPRRPEAFDRFPNAKHGMPGHGPDYGGMAPPPPGDEMPGEVPPPPAD